jgi:hypothetical protein
MDELTKSLVSEVKQLRERVDSLETGREEDRRASTGTPIYPALAANGIVLVTADHALGTHSGLVCLDGRVGIGTTLPAAWLHIRDTQAETSTTASDYFRFDVAGGLVGRIYRDFNGTHNYLGIESFNVGNSVKTPIALQEYGGNVGIGTSTPDLELDVQSASTVYTGIELTNTNGSTRRWAVGSNSNSATFGPAKGFIVRDISVNTTRFAIDTTGRVYVYAAPSSASAEAGGISIVDPGNTNRKTYLGWDTGLNGGLGGGYIQSVLTGTTYYPTHINPLGGNVGIGLGTTTPTYRIELPNTASVAGQGRANAWVTYSSAIWKNRIRNPERVAHKERLKQLRLVEYDNKPEVGGGHSLGLIAEEVAEVFPEVVTGDVAQPETLALDYGRLGVLMLPVVQELVQEVEKLKATTQQQEKTIEGMQRQVEQLTRSVEALQRRPDRP